MQLNTQTLNLLLLQILVMLVVGIAGGIVARKWLRQPSVFGEISAGILLGPAVLGTLAPGLYTLLFPKGAAIEAAYGAVIGLSMLFFLFAAGLEIEVAQLRRTFRTAVATGLLGTLVPFVLGVGAAYALPKIWLIPASTDPLVFALFLGTALSITALPVISRVLADLGLQREPVGVIVMAAATMSDLIGWSMLAVVLSYAGTGAGPGETPQFWKSAALVVVFAILLVRFGRRWARKAIDRAHLQSGSARIVMLYIAMLFGAALLAHALGIHPSLGAFMGGVAMASIGSYYGHHAPHSVIEFAHGFFAPIYIVSIGIRVDFSNSFDFGLVALVVILATVGKLSGSYLGARISGIEWRSALAIGFGMNARGAMEIVLAGVALEYKLIDQRLFVALVTMALLTSMLSGPMMQRLLRPQRSDGLREGSKWSNELPAAPLRNPARPGHSS